MERTNDPAADDAEDGENQIPMECPEHGPYTWHIFDLSTFYCPSCPQDDEQDTDATT